MRKWRFKNGIEVHENSYNYDLHCFAVYSEDGYLGSIYPDTIEDMKSCIRQLDNGNDPVSDEWEDGLGNICTIDGWGSND